MVLVQLLQALARHVGIDLRGRDIGVAEQELHDAQIRAMVEQMRGEGVAQRVRRERSAREGCPGALLYQVPERLPRHRTTAPRDEHVVAGPFPQKRGPAFLRIARQPGERLLTERHEALLRALAEDADHAHVEAHLGELQAHELRNAQPARVEHFQQRTVAQPERYARVRLREQRFDIDLRERLWKARRLLRGIELERGIDLDAPPAREEPIEALEA